MTLTSKPLAIIIVVTIFAGIFFADMLGWWQTKKSGQGERYGQQGGSQVGPAAANEGKDHRGSGERVIRGRTTFAELLQWGLTQAQIEAALGASMPSDPHVVIRDYCTQEGLRYGQVKARLQALLTDFNKE
jgi:hypothetical protein